MRRRAWRSVPLIMIIKGEWSAFEMVVAGMLAVIYATLRDIQESNRGDR